MAQFAANLTLLFNEVPMLERPEWARRTGFDGAEVLFPYDHAAADWERALAGLPLALINTPPGNWGAGQRGFAARSEDVATFRTGFLQAADYATRLKVPCIHVMAGVAQGAAAEEVFLENLAWASAQIPDLSLTIEPLNPDDMPGYFLNDFDQAARIIDALANPRIGLQFDLWHASKLHGNADHVWKSHKHRIRHVQIAGFPTRNEPGGGGFSLPQLCDEVSGLDAVWIAAEYRPAKGTAQGLFWLNALKSRGQALIGQNHMP